MKHLNDNLLCVVTVFLTGMDHQRDDILQFCVAPLDQHLKIHPAIPPFFATLQPRRWNCDKEWLGADFYKVADLIKIGVDPYFVADEFEKWFVKYRIRDVKRIMPLAYNWALIRPFLMDWLGYEHFIQTFDYRYRDLLAASVYCNDRAYWHSEDYPYPKHNFTYICSQSGVPYEKKYDCMQQAMVLAACYRKMQSTWIGA